MSENPYTFDEDQFGFFTEAVSAALSVADIPLGVIGGDHIADGSIQPENCALDASWDFSGGISSPSLSMANSAASAALSRSARYSLSTRIVYDHHKLGGESVLLVNANKKVLNVTLPPAGSSKNRVYFIKRVDDNKQSDCTVVPARGDKIDFVTSISVPERGCIMCISSGEDWHILSNYS